MPRESTITVLRSTTTDVPTGLTFGEIAYSDLNGKFHIGKGDGTSLWIGAQITAGDITTNSQYIIPTQSAVKSYVDGAIGGGSGVVNTVNATGGAITITGDGGALFNTQAAKANTVGVRLATTGVTGVASFNSSYFSVSSGAVSLASGYQATGDSVQAGSGIAISANKTITNIGVTGFNGLTGGITVTGDGGSLVGIGNTNFTNRLATTGVTGVASFNSTYFSVASGGVSLASGYQVTGDTVVAGTAISVTRSGNSATISNTGVRSFNGNTGTIEITSDGGAVALNNTTSAADYARVVTVRLASTSLTGVASFNSTDFTVSATGQVGINTTTSSPFVLRDQYGSTVSPKYSATVTITGGFGIETDIDESIANAIAIRGATASSTKVGVASYDSAHFSVGSTAHVRLAAAYQVTGDTVQGDSGAITTSGTGTKTVSARLATTSLTGVASFNSTYFGVASGAVSLASAYQVTGDTVAAGTGISVTRSGNSATITNIGVTGFNGLTGGITVTGDGGSLVGVGNTNFTNRLATTGVTGVASFNSTHFSVSSGAVSSTGITVKANSADAGTTLNLGGTLTITGTVSQVSVSRSNTEFTIGLPNDITIPGNLTVNGTVVTANVDSFVVEDPLIMLGTGNAADTVDLGFFGQYTSSGKRFAGIFRDASDSGKFKFFTGLSGGVEPTTFVNDAGSGYTVATIVTKIDGGTF